MSAAADTLENASILSDSAAHEGHRLWIGNIDPKITEYHLVKLLEKFGKVKQFDFLFHKSGPLEGQPRGYCFVNFHTKEEAERAIQCLNGKLALSKKLVVRWAHAQVKVLRTCWGCHCPVGGTGAGAVGAVRAVLGEERTHSLRLSRCSAFSHSASILAVRL
ncbi:probable RNA-binding protein 18 isoform X3 [Clupea harengus]|uniref:Probable RNA-binding protein 18 n=1 Tax=Clupea harengus TaxID=7950 RepID=A0A6P8GEY9_CLUHA|nr:probable RNA-binding protein 18 isoform X3 [Clupea harengus]